MQSTSTKAPLTPHLARLEAESIGIIREVAASFRKPVMLYSIGKDGLTKKPISQKDSLDDVLRANDGRFVDLASKF